MPGVLDRAGNILKSTRQASKPDRAKPPELPAAGFIAVGRVLASWGRRGEVKVEPLTDFPDRFNPGCQLYLRERAMSIEGSHWQKGRMILKLAGTDSIDAAEKLRGEWLTVPEAERRPLEAGQYYVDQVMGLEVYNGEGRLLGTVGDVLHTGGNDVYVVSGQGQELLLPAIEDVVRSIDLEQRRMIVELLPGLGE